MARKANYFEIGLFVIAAVVVVILGVIFLGGRALMQKYVYMETYLDESVEGLTVGSSVNFRGVEIGRVSKISFVSMEYPGAVPEGSYTEYGKYVMVVIASDYEPLLQTPAEELPGALKERVAMGLRIRLKSRPLTGAAYLEADYVKSEQYPGLEIHWTPRNPYIPSAPSILSQFTETAELAFRRLAKLDIETLVQRTSELLNALNKIAGEMQMDAIRKDVGQLVADLRRSSTDLRSLILRPGQQSPASTLEDVIHSARKAVEEAKVPALSEDVRVLLKEVRETNRQVQTLLARREDKQPAATLGQTIARLDKTLSRLDLLLKRQAPQVERTTTELNAMIANLRELTRDLKANPGKLLTGDPPAKSRIVR